MTIGDRITELMKLKGLTQKKLGDIVGYSDVAIGKLQKNKNEPKFVFFKKLAEYYPDVNITYLITGIGEIQYSNVRGGNDFSISEIVRLNQENEEELKEYPPFKDFVIRMSKNYDLLGSIQKDIVKLQKEVRELRSK